MAKTKNKILKQVQDDDKKKSSLGDKKIKPATSKGSVKKEPDAAKNKKILGQAGDDGKEPNDNNQDADRTIPSSSRKRGSKLKQMDLYEGDGSVNFEGMIAGEDWIDENE